MGSAGRQRRGASWPAAGRGWRLFFVAVFALLAGGAAFWPARGDAPTSGASPLAGGAGQGVPVLEETLAVDEPSLGAALFAGDFSLEDGLGPLFNATSCAACHQAPVLGGTGPEGLGVALRVGRLVEGAFDPLEGRGGPVARRRSVTELGVACDLRPGVPSVATLTSVRNAPALFGLGLIDLIPDEVILAGAVPREGGVYGRPHLVLDDSGAGRVGRFGWKADTASLATFVGVALRDEHGITNPLAPVDALPTGAPSCGPASGQPEDDGTKVAALTAFVASLPVPALRPADEPSLVAEGGRLLAAMGCLACHTQSS